jgi:hypothetical protein
MKFFNTAYKWICSLWARIFAKPTRTVPTLAVDSVAVQAEKHGISGNAGIADAKLFLVGPVIKETVADADGQYSFTGLLDGVYVLKPFTFVPGHTFLPELQIVAIAGEDVIANFIDPSSPVDSRINPNASRNVQGSLIYDVQTSSNPAIPPTDSRISKPVDARTASIIPQNSRS